MQDRVQNIINNSYIKIIRIIILLNLFPLVRSCDDATGKTDTFGFPVPFMTYTRVFSEANYWYIAINIFTLLTVLLWLTRYHKRIAETLTGFSFFWKACLLLVVMHFIGLFFFFPALLAIFAVDLFISVDENNLFGLLMDMFVRLEFSGVLLILYFFSRGSQEPEKEETS